MSMKYGGNVHSVRIGLCKPSVQVGRENRL